jgi:hypothetical protein
LFLLVASALSARADLPPTYLQCLISFEAHADTIWHEAGGTGRPPDSGYWGDGNSGGNGGIRGSCGVAVAHAVLVRSLPGDPLNATRLERIRKALNYAAHTHLSGTNTCIDGKQWGHGWQSALWGGSMGLACLLVQADLPAETVAAVQRAVADEATFRAGIPPASGYVGDTKAEENGWDSNILALSAAWLAGHPNAGLWLDAAKRYLVNTYTVADTTGDPLASWITTVTLHPSYALENHGFYHPTYHMVAGMSLGDSLLMARLANPAVAAELQPFAEHNVTNVWSMLQNMVLDSGEFAYPSGLDWALHDYEQNSYYAWLATHFNDPLARHADSNLVQLVRYRQLVNGDGRFVGESEANGFYREAVEARRTAIAWLHHQHGDHPTGPVTAHAPVLAHFPDVRILVQRGPSGFVSLSYGPKIMALVEPPARSVPTNAFITTPRLPGIIGLGALGNPTSAQLVRLVTNGNDFEAELTVVNGANGTTDVYVKSTGETVAIVEVPRPVPGFSGTSAGSFSVGIENDPLTGGTRLLEWAGGTTLVTNRTGGTRHVTNDWVCVSDYYGMAAGPTGYFRYQTAASYNRLGAAQDTLQFMPQEILGTRYAVWFPGWNAAQTAVGAAAIEWLATGTNAVLTFPGPTGSVHQIAVVLPVPPPYPAYAVPVVSVSASSSQANYPPTNAVDGDPSTFWVSSGSLAGEGPTPEDPEWLAFSFPRVAAVSEFEIAPRTLNGGYGPKTIQMLLDGEIVFSGAMSNATLRVPLTAPVNASNAQLVITSSFDPVYPTNSRNVQVVEVVFRERAQPGSYGDWAVRRFTDAQLADAGISGSGADPEADGAPNLLEFATGGDPFLPDAGELRLQGLSATNGQFMLQFREGTGMIDVARWFEAAPTLNAWAEIEPIEIHVRQDAGEWRLLEAVLPQDGAARYYRIGYRQSSAP